jgi:hypothetical protein
MAETSVPASTNKSGGVCALEMLLVPRDRMGRTLSWRAIASVDIARFVCRENNDSTKIARIMIEVVDLVCYTPSGGEASGAGVRRILNDHSSIGKLGMVSKLRP